MSQSQYQQGFQANVQCVKQLMYKTLHKLLLRFYSSGSSIIHVCAEIEVGTRFGNSRSEDDRCKKSF